MGGCVSSREVTLFGHAAVWRICYRIPNAHFFHGCDERRLRRASDGVAADGQLIRSHDREERVWICRIWLYHDSGPPRI